MDAVQPFVADTSRPGVLVLRVEQFDKGLGPWMGSALEGLPPDVDVVLDLRGNPGGRLWEAESVLTCFLPRNQAWATRTGRTGRAVVLRAAGDCGDRRDPLANPVAVLVVVIVAQAVFVDPVVPDLGRAGMHVGIEVVAVAFGVGVAVAVAIADARQLRLLHRVERAVAEAEAEHFVEPAGEAFDGRLRPFVEHTAQQQDLAAARAAIQAIRVEPAVQQYIVAVCRATRQAPALQLGVSPRGTTTRCRRTIATTVAYGRSRRSRSQATSTKK